MLKVILCTALFIGVYKMILENEKMYRFNRGYLLITLLLPIALPFITFYQERSTVSEWQTIIPENVVAPENVEATIVGGNPTSIWPNLLLGIYLIVAFVLLIRFLIHLRSMLLKAYSYPGIGFNGSTIVLINRQVIPHSFLRYLFVNKTAYESNAIQKEIFSHELAHIRQKHSLDLLLFEIVQIVFWFNPLLPMYKRALQLNHEFLADEAVLKESSDIDAYQLLVLQYSGNPIPAALSSSFNFSLTKKRLLMMAQTKSSKKAFCKQLTLVPVFAVAVLLFSTKLIAQDSTLIKNENKVEATNDGITQEQLDEYEQIVRNAGDKDGFPRVSKISATDRKRLETLFSMMSKDQQSKQVIRFTSMAPLERKPPSVAQFESWKNGKLYGVWIDDKRVSNSVLNNYKYSDFGHISVSKLSKIAKNYGKHYYQVDIMTNSYYEAYVKQQKEQEIKYTLVVHWKGEPYHILEQKATK